jgi:hypothetical protein
MSKRFQPTPEQLVLSEQRKAKKAKLSASAVPATIDETKGRILARKWVQLPIAPPIDVSRVVKVMTWNVSAIRSSRKVFRDLYVFIVAGTMPCP